VTFCNAYDIPFLAQNGGNGWATTFTLKNNGVLINLARLNEMTFNSDRTRATIGGGTRINDTIAAANSAGALVETGNCNCVGTLGAYLGGGYGNLLGLYGFGVDNILSMRVVTANGTIKTVSSTSNSDLFQLRYRDIRRCQIVASNVGAKIRVDWRSYLLAGKVGASGTSHPGPPSQT
jgi:FAD/FMN-containing dehydrogenase